MAEGSKVIDLIKDLGSVKLSVIVPFVPNIVPIDKSKRSEEMDISCFPAIDPLIFVSFASIVKILSDAFGVVVR